MPDCNLVIKELPVAYDVVTEVVPQLWKEFNPKVIFNYMKIFYLSVIHLKYVCQVN